ncbi:MAG: hypothetical protein ACO3XO_07685 [Bdellovibrionota bacterium]
MRIDSGDYDTVTKGAVSSSSGASQRKAKGKAAQDTSAEVIQQTVAEDPLAKFLQKNWRFLAIVISIIVAIAYGKNFFEQTRYESLRRSADLLLSLQQQVEQLSQVELQSTDEATGEFEQGLARAQELRRALSQERDPYATLSPLYEAVLLQMQAEKKEALPNVSGSQVTHLDGGVFTGVIAELRSFQQALSLLAPSIESTPDASAVGALKEIVRGGRFTGSAALAVLQAVTMNDAESQAELKELTQEYIMRNPEQADIIRRELPLLSE